MQGRWFIFAVPFLWLLLFSASFANDDICDSRHPDWPDSGNILELEQQGQDVTIRFAIWERRLKETFSLIARRGDAPDDVLLEEVLFSAEEGVAEPVCVPHYYYPECDYVACNPEDDNFSIYEIMLSTCSVWFHDLSGNILYPGDMDFICEPCHRECFETYYLYGDEACCEDLIACIEDTCGGTDIDTDPYYLDCDNDGTKECGGECTSVIHFEQVDSCACPGESDYRLYMYDRGDKDRVDRESIQVEDTGDSCLAEKDCSDESADDTGKEDETGGLASDDDSEEDGCGCRTGQGNPAPFLVGLMAAIGLLAEGVFAFRRRR